MNFLPMYYFTVVVKSRNINQAAHELHITQQTLSSHMAALEKELQCRLFHRHPNFALTYAGEKFYRYAADFIRTYDSMQQEFRDMEQHHSDNIHIGIARTRSKVLMPRLISSFVKEAPYIQVSLSENTNDALIQELLDGRLDLIIARFTMEHPEMKIEPLYREQMTLAVPADIAPTPPLDVRCLTTIPLLMNSKNDIAGHIAMYELQKAGITPKIIAASDNIEVLLGMCLLGMGACFCSDYLLDHVLTPAQQKHICRIPLHQTYEIQMAWLNKVYVRKSIRIFAQHCRTAFPSLVSSDNAGKT